MVINPPDVTSFNHTVALIGLYGETNNPKMVIWLVGNYDYKKATYFIDYDQDRDFTNDLKPVVIDSRRGSQNVNLKIDEKVESFTVDHKKQDESLIKPTSVIDTWSLSLFGGVGVGSIEYGYQNTDLGFPNRI